MRSRRKGRSRAFALAMLGACGVIAACTWDPARPFDRESPQVREAIGALDAGDAKGATATLEDYLSTGACAEGSIGAPELVKKRPDGTFDLGLSLFKIGESFGRRFGEEELDAGGDEKSRAERGAQIACALRVIGAIAGDDAVSIDLRARAHYLEGNLNFLDGHYDDAVHAYDKALTLAPGEAVDAGDALGRDAAWNRAIALKRIEDKKDSGHDASEDTKNDGPSDSGHDSGDSSQDSGDSGGKDSGGEKDSGGGGQDSGGQDSGGGDSGGGADSSTPPPQPPDSGSPPPASQSQDDRVLDQLENAPTVQQEAAKKAASRHQRRGMADK